MSLLNKYEQKLKQKTLLERVEEKMEQQPPSTPNPIPTTLLDRVEKVRQQPTINEEAFNKYVENHRSHQLKAVRDSEDSTQGQIIIPTGTGKTRIQIHKHIEHMIEKSKNQETGVYVIAAHRLLLCTQLMDELRHMCIECGLPVNVLYIGSARHDDKLVYDKYFHKGIDSGTFESEYTTSEDSVLEFYNKTSKLKRHLIIVSTYHSFHKMKCINKIDICTYDEAHTTIQDNFSENILEVKDNIEHNYFFTATRKTSGGDGGMNDSSLYGDVLCGISPKEMIEAGEIVMPRIHIMMLKDDEKIKDNNETMLVKTVIEGFEEHRKKLKEESAHPDKLGAKLLVSAKGSDELNIIQSSGVFQKWCTDSNVKVFSFSSRYGSYHDFEEEVNRTYVYESMKNLKDTDDCILLHIDILTEGIDLPSITAVMLLRHLNITKLLQTLGRALRLLKSDREKLYSGLITPHEKNKYTKPYAYMMLPMHFESLDASSEEVKRMIRAVISEYGLPTEEFLPLEEFAALKNEYLDPVTDLSKKRKKDKEYPLLHVIEEFIIEEFQMKLPKDPLESYNYLTELLRNI